MVCLVPNPAQLCTLSGPEFLTLPLTDSQMPETLLIAGPSKILPTSFSYLLPPLF